MVSGLHKSNFLLLMPFIVIKPVIIWLCRLLRYALATENLPVVAWLWRRRFILHPSPQLPNSCSASWTGTSCDSGAAAALSSTDPQWHARDQGELQSEEVQLIWQGKVTGQLFFCTKVLNLKDHSSDFVCFICTPCSTIQYSLSYNVFHFTFLKHVYKLLQTHYLCLVW